MGNKARKISQYLKKMFSKKLARLVVLIFSISIIIPTKIAFAAGIGAWVSDYIGADVKASLSLLTFPLGMIQDVIFRILFVGIDMILAYLVSVAKWLFDWALLLSVNNSLMGIVHIGWSKSLAFANNFFMLIFLAIALSTILGLEYFNYKKMLPIFLMVILLINFSLVFGQVIIDATNVIAISFSGGIASKLSASLYTGEALKVQDPQAKMADPKVMGMLDDASKNFNKLFYLFLYQAFIYLVSILVFLSGAIYMMQRAFWLAFLLMVAPLAWIALLIPNLKQHYSKWWEKFIKWAIFAPAFLFFLNLGLEIGYAASNQKNLTGIVGELGGIDVGKVIGILITAFIMMAGLSISSALGVGGSNFVLNYADKSRKKMTDTFKKFMPTQTYGEKIGEWAARRATGALTLGGRVSVPGVLEAKKIRTVQSKEAFDKAKEKYETAGPAELWEMIQGAQKNKTTSPEVAAAINKFLSLPENERELVGGPRSDDEAILELRTMASAGSKGDRTYAYQAPTGTTRKKQEQEFTRYAEYLTEQAKKQEERREKAGPSKEYSKEQEAAGVSRFGNE